MTKRVHGMIGVPPTTDGGGDPGVQSAGSEPGSPPISRPGGGKVGIREWAAQSGVSRYVATRLGAVESGLHTFEEWARLYERMEVWDGKTPWTTFKKEG